MELRGDDHLRSAAAGVSIEDSGHDPGLQDGRGLGEAVRPDLVEEIGAARGQCAVPGVLDEGPDRVHANQRCVTIAREAAGAGVADQKPEGGRDVANADPDDRCGGVEMAGKARIGGEQVCGHGEIGLPVVRTGCPLPGDDAWRPGPFPHLGARGLSTPISSSRVVPDAGRHRPLPSPSAGDGRGRRAHRARPQRSHGHRTCGSGTRSRGRPAPRVPNALSRGIRVVVMYAPGFSADLSCSAPRAILSSVPLMPVTARHALAAPVASSVATQCEEAGAGTLQREKAPQIGTFSQSVPEEGLEPPTRGL
jgi:hypothetical protein